MRVLVLPLLAVITGCASTTPGPTSSPTSTVRVMGEGGGALTLTSSTMANVTTIPFSIDQVWRVLPAVYDSLSIPITTVEPSKHLVANEGFKLRQTLGKTPLSRYIDCGATQIGANADSYDVYMTIVTHADAGSEGTKLSTTLEAAAKPVSFSQAYSRCTSRGVLETRIADVLKALVRK
jgi:hypothetical protein